MFMQERKKKIFLIHRWDYIRERRQEQYEATMQLKMERKQKFIWCQNIMFIQIMKHIYGVFDSKRTAFIKDLKQQFGVNMFAIKFRVWQRKKRFLYDERIQQKAQNCLAVAACYMHGVKEYTAGKFLRHFLRETSEIKDLKDRCYKYCDSVIYIQRTLVTYNLSMVNRVKFMQLIYFEKEKNYLIKQCMIKKSKKKQMLWKKLNLIDDNLKEKVCEVWMLRCKYRAAARIFEWKADFVFGNRADDVSKTKRFIFIERK